MLFFVSIFTSVSILLLGYLILIATVQLLNGIN